MITFEGIEENFTFLVVEVERQVRATVSFLDRPSHSLYDRIVGRDDYVDNLHTVIENKCYGYFHDSGAGQSLDKTTANRVRAIQGITVNLERVADFCVNIVQQTNYLTDHSFLHSYSYADMSQEIEACLGHIQPVIQSGNLADALTLCRAEYTLDRQYKAGFDRIMGELRTGKNVQNLITVLFIFRYLERIGDALLNIGEALIFAILGERIKIEQFEALQQTLSKTGFKGGMEGVDFKAIWGTRSGCRIGRVDTREGASAGDALGSIYKEGTIKKIRAEKEALQRWGRLYPGLVAGVFGFHEDGDKASILVEFLPGCNLDEVLLTASSDIVQNAMFVLTQTVQDIWENTRTGNPISAAFMSQLKARLDEVLQIHPDFLRKAKVFGDRNVASTAELLETCAGIEKELPAPFGVLIHGDFNVNNVVYNHQKQRLHYLDVHRSREQDYVQDVSVFLISNYRMPVFEPHLRERIDWVIAEFLQFASEFAARSGDTTFAVRMALALARSFYTSSRFELNYAFSREMCLRAHYLLERVAAHQDSPWEAFRLPEHILFH
ncbi:MAG: phosphate uptake regulator PhoU [Humidesulfovibrio sp.]|nr:phosphate uptake regulator PhoU [Humidesulfovibrio sp.]